MECVSEMHEKDMPNVGGTWAARTELSRERVCSRAMSRCLNGL
jgi:hypothetical protein